MELPAFSGRRKSINLLPKDPFESSSVGVILEWALAFGKWAVIVTQLVVMGAFLWRFTLDRKLTNLRREIDQQQAVIKSYSQMETEFIIAQKRLAYIKPAIESEKAMISMLTTIQSLTPPDVWYERLNISEGKVSLSAYSSSLTGFSRLLTAFQRQKEFTSVNVSSIEDGGAKDAQLMFDITLSYGAKKK